MSSKSGSLDFLHQNTHPTLSLIQQPQNSPLSSPHQKMETAWIFASPGKGEKNLQGGLTQAFLCKVTGISVCFDQDKITGVVCPLLSHPHSLFLNSRTESQLFIEGLSVLLLDAIYLKPVSPLPIPSQGGLISFDNHHLEQH